MVIFLLQICFQTLHVHHLKHNCDINLYQFTYLPDELGSCDVKSCDKMVNPLYDVTIFKEKSF